MGACRATGSSKAARQTPDAAPTVVCAHNIRRYRALQQHLMLKFITAWQGHPGDVRVCHSDCMLHSYLNCLTSQQACRCNRQVTSAHCSCWGCCLVECWELTMFVSCRGAVSLHAHRQSKLLSPVARLTDIQPSSGCCLGRCQSSDAQHQSLCLQQGGARQIKGIPGPDPAGACARQGVHAVEADLELCLAVPCMHWNLDCWAISSALLDQLIRLIWCTSRAAPLLAPAQRMSRGQSEQLSTF